MWKKVKTYLYRRYTIKYILLCINKKIENGKFKDWFYCF